MPSKSRGRRKVPKFLRRSQTKVSRVKAHKVRGEAAITSLNTDLDRIGVVQRVQLCHNFHRRPKLSVILAILSCEQLTVTPGRAAVTLRSPLMRLDKSGPPSGPGGKTSPGASPESLKGWVARVARELRCANGGIERFFVSPVSPDRRSRAAAGRGRAAITVRFGGIRLAVFTPPQCRTCRRAFAHVSNSHDINSSSAASLTSDPNRSRSTILP
jgi:hypothetical protein